MRFQWKSLFLVVSAVLLVAAVATADDVPMADNAYIGNDACFDCHDTADLGMQADVHMQIQSFEVQGREVGCEGCHGPGKLHMEESDPELIRSFSEGADYSEAVCMDCHATKNLPEWNASIHALEAVTCTDCHGVHGKKNIKPNQACTACHADTRAAFELPSHHPLREGKMECSTCHNPHSATEFMLKTRMRTADLCYTCHQDKEGPFIFEHPPVQEDCSLCHTPHGSVANNLLTANEPTLCLQCHDFHFHTGYQASDSHEVDVGGIERDNPFGPPAFQIAYSTNCTQCHSRIHGSDTPSQTTTNWGKGLTQ